MSTAARPRGANPDARRGEGRAKDESVRRRVDTVGAVGVLGSGPSGLIGEDTVDGSSVSVH